MKDTFTPLLLAITNRPADKHELQGKSVHPEYKWLNEGLNGVCNNITQGTRER
ncbi:hypothetical protein C5167_043937 [Papaver somniferum]|uniref:Uncharacterized protein n=1 Tax=Papaver somniferum TaxID=3469 RepID=A0A4Y7L9K8_PAPSO|nr:hypothetical protein C5167_043937 [Papaver somniferum]